MATKIKVSDLIKHPFKEIICDGYWDIQHILSELNINEYNLKGFDPNLFKIREIYDNPHQSDECSYRRLIFFRDKFCCLYGYTGDRGTSTVEFANKEIAEELRMYLATLEQISYSILDEEVILSDHYTTFVQDDDNGEFYYNIQNPEWGGNFSNKAENVYYVGDNNKLTHCMFIRTKFKRRGYEQIPPEDKRLIVELLEGDKKGEVIEADYWRIIFKV